MYSELVSYVNFSKNTYGKRDIEKINKIVPHCYVGSPSVKRGTDSFSAKWYEWSCNYYIDAEGKIGAVLPEEYASICTSNKSVDMTGITVEMACSPVYPYTFKDATIDAFVKLSKDIMKRYNKIKCVWIPEKTKNKNYKIMSDEMLITVHRFFAAKSCPGEHFFSNLSAITDRINFGSSNPIMLPDGLGIRSSKIGQIDFNKLDYSKVFDWKYYRNKYADLTQNGLKTQEDFTRHFKTDGLLQARQGTSTFNPIAYRNNNSDLNNIFGDEWEWYYAHYIMAGYKEGRKTL